jgi:hypothetical protein
MNYFEKTNQTVKNSNSSDGNILETLNLVFELTNNNHINLDLTKTGNVIHLLTAGFGVINVRNTELYNITMERLKQKVLPLDFICFSNPPLHGIKFI